MESLLVAGIYIRFVVGIVYGFGTGISTGHMSRLLRMDECRRKDDVIMDWWLEGFRHPLNSNLHRAHQRTPEEGVPQFGLARVELSSMVFDAFRLSGSG